MALAFCYQSATFQALEIEHQIKRRKSCGIALSKVNCMTLEKNKHAGLNKHQLQRQTTQFARELTRTCSRYLISSSYSTSCLTNMYLAPIFQLINRSFKWYYNFERS